MDILFWLVGARFTQNEETCLNVLRPPGLVNEPYHDWKCHHLFHSGVSHMYVLVPESVQVIEWLGRDNFFLSGSIIFLHFLVNDN